ncbi:MAG TPA: hypothetical protein VMW09_02450 [Desulfatiglandales bacterium]|nr:hypothetical protein [Desulfatiglandales bacterium]
MYTEEMYHIVPILSDQDLTGAAAMSGDSINMSKYHHCTYIVGFQDLDVAPIYVLVYSGATDGAKTSALTFNYAFGGAAAGSANCDVYAAWATSANLSVAHATYDNYTLLIEVPAAIMDIANGEKWLTIVFADTDTNATGNVQVHAILHPRYGGSAISALV